MPSLTRNLSQNIICYIYKIQDIIQSQNNQNNLTWKFMNRSEKEEAQRTVHKH